MGMFGKIRRMYWRDKLSLHEIARRTGLSRNTLRRWLREEKVGVPKYRRNEVVSKVSAYHDVLKQALKADSHRNKQNRRTGKDLFKLIQQAGYDGSYSQVLRYLRTVQEAGSKTSAFVPLKFALGEAFQFDWSEEGLVIGGIYYRLQVSHMKLCASRAFWLVAYPSQGHEMLFDAHTRSFRGLGGIPRRGIYDNMKTAVDRVNKGRGRVVNARFAVMCAHYLFDADFCNVASGWEKGVVEKNVQDSRRRIWLEAQGRRFATFEELNHWLAERCTALWGELYHPEHRDFTIAEMLEQEREHMMPMPVEFDGYVEKPARVSSTCLVSVCRNRYSVPCEFVGKMVSTQLYPNRVCVVADNNVVASHPRLPNRGGQVCYDWQHYIPLVERKPGALRNGAPFADLPEPFRQLRLGLLRHEGGDKIMAQVLAAVLTSGLDAVLVAVELVIESRALSAEHILNVLGRLNATPLPACIETDLQLVEAPLANTSRYDALREAVEAIVGESGHA